MSPRPNPENNPEFWPLLSLLGSRSVLYSQGNSALFEQALPSTDNRPGLIETFESDLSRGRKIERQKLLWKPDDSASVSFLTHCYKTGIKNGGIRIHSLFAPDIPLEALHFPEEKEHGDLTVLRMTELSFIQMKFANQNESPFSRIRRIKIFIFFNPTFEPELPQARRDSEEIEQLLADKAELRYIARGLTPEDVSEHYTWADLIFYFGHGKMVSGFPAIPSSNGWIPFPDQNLTTGSMFNKIVFFAACMDNKSDQPKFFAGCSVYPRCRIADRKSAYLHDLVRYWKTGTNLYSAFRSAAIMDREKEDIRRYVFQIQGQNHLALSPAVFAGNHSV